MKIFRTCQSLHVKQLAEISISLLLRSVRLPVSPLQVVFIALAPFAFLPHSATAEDELAALTLSSPTPTVSSDISERNIEQRESELKSIEEGLLQKINTSRPNPTSTSQSGQKRVDTARATDESSSGSDKTPTVRTAAFTTGDTPRRAKGATEAADRSDSLAPERGPAHSVPVEQAPAKVSAEQRLAIAESQVTILSRELETSRRGLRSAEKRIEELADLVKGRSAAPRSSHSEFTYGNDRDSLRNIRSSHTVSLDEGDEEVFAQPTIRSHSSSLVSVTASKAAVRTGPSKGDSMLFLLPAGSQVAIDRRSGEWYRVVTDTGARGWIFGQSLLFDDGTPSGSAVRVKAVRSKYEPTHLRY
jgi:hypothetical protein